MPRKTEPKPQSWLVTYLTDTGDRFPTFGSVLVSRDPLSSEELYGAVVKVIRENNGLGEDVPVCITNVMPCQWSIE